MRRLAALGALLLIACTQQTPRLLPEAVELAPVGYGHLPGWREDATDKALAAFRHSCAVIEKRADDHLIGIGPAAAPARGWKEACLHARGLAENDPETAQRYFEQYFIPFKVSNRGDTAGLFTGYYEPLVRGSRQRGGKYIVPLYRLPDEKKEGVPFYDRKDINAGALAHKGLEIAWLEDPIEAFFLQIQGSGRIALEEGGIIRVGYGGRNDQPYVPIGKILIERGELAPENVSMQSIKAWLRTHPDKAQEVMEQNPSYIFFREISGDAALGAQDVPLTPMRSIAVDSRYIPLGAPVFLDTFRPSTADAPAGFMRSLMVAQDTGSAIRGPVRADIFFGTGPQAEQLSGLMKSGGEYYLLLPKAAIMAKQEAVPGCPAPSFWQFWKSDAC